MIFVRVITCSQALVSCSPFAAKLGIGMREVLPNQGVELSRNASLRHYGAFKQCDSVNVEDSQLWSAVCCFLWIILW